MFDCMKVKKEMESTMINNGNNLDEKVNSNVDNVVKSKIGDAKRMIRNENCARGEVDTLLTERKWDLESLKPRLKYMQYFNRYGYKNPTTKIQKLQQAMAYLVNYHSITNKGANIKRLCHQMNKCNNSKEERRILKEIQLVEETPNSEDDMDILKPWEWRYWDLGLATNSTKILRQRIDEAYKELEVSSALTRKRIDEEENLKKEFEKAKNDIISYRAKLEKINKNKAELYEYILLLQKQLDKNCIFRKK